MDREIVECFKAYKKVKMDDYAILIDGRIKMVPHRFIYKKKDKKSINLIPYYSKEQVDELWEKIEEGGHISIPTLSIVDDHIVERLSPDNIDSRIFWKKAVKDFPLFSICGGVPQEYTVESANYFNFQMHYAHGALSHLYTFLDKEVNNMNYTQMLEIGPGYGNICQHIEEIAKFVTYHAIDVNPLFEHPRLFQTDGKTIPDEIPMKLDLVYSINVFQHLSKKQRSSYYQQIHDRLIPGGVFLFGMFVITPNNENWPVWGLRDKSGTYYAQFFRQLTEIDKVEDLQNELEDIGFQFENISLHEDKINCLTFKCTKI